MGLLHKYQDFPVNTIQFLVEFFSSLFCQIPPWGSVYSKHSKSLSLQQSGLQSRLATRLRTVTG